MKIMNIKMAIHSQLSTFESKKQTKQISRAETGSQIWRSFGGLLVGREKGEDGGKGEGIKKYKLVGTEQTGGCYENYRKWSRQRIYIHDPWT